MCGETKCGAGAPDEDCCRFVYDEDPSNPDSDLPGYQPSARGKSGGIECVCFYVPSPGFKAQQYQENQISSKGPSFPGVSAPLANDLFEECYPEKIGSAPQGLPVSQTPGHLRNICDLPPHENLAIPYPRPAPSVELRGGQIYSGCQCVKRDGLQHDCPRTGCQGKAPCMAYPAPVCVPSGNAPPDPPSEVTRQRGMWPRGGRNQVAPKQRGAGAGGYQYQAADDDDRYVRMGRRGYRENPPVKQRPRVPCEEHRKTRC